MSIVSKKIMMGSGAAGDPVDDEFNRTSFLSHFEGANNGVNNAFDDGSASNHTITANGNATQGSFGPFARPDGEWGWSFDASAEGLVLDYGSTSHNYWNGNFTFEFWVNNTDTDSSNTLFGCWEDNAMSNGSYNVSFAADGKIGFLNRQSSGSNNGAFITCATAINDGAWHHIAITQVDDGGSTKYFRIFVDGVLDAYDTETSWTQGASGQEITIGGLSIIASSYESARRYTGLISNWRIVESIVYSTASTTIGATIFTPPTGPLTAISNTRILSCQSNRFVDNSTNGYAVNSNGNGKTTAFGPFLTSAVYDAAVNGASAHFDGSGESLVVDATVISQSGNFTFEGWAYSNSTASQTIGGQYSGGGTGRMVIYSDSGNIRFFQNANPAISYNGSSGKLLNQWCHFVLMRTGSNIALYINGVRVLNATAKNIEQSDFIVGAENSSGNNSMNGYISNIRCTSSAVYSEGTSITVPTAPYSTVTNTNLLLNMADGQAIDSAAQNNLTLYGTAKTSTAQKKFGTASLLLDGNSDYVSFADADSGSMFNFGATKWTIEGWFYQENNAGSSSNSHSIISRWDNQNSDKGFIFRITDSSGQKLQWLHTTDGSTNVIYTDSRTISNDTWYHFALVKNDNLTLYLNGTGAVLNSSTFTIVSTTIPTLIGSLHESGSPSQYFDGYIDDLRVSHMARYTSDFTAPSAAFPDKGQDA